LQLKQFALSRGLSTQTTSMYTAREPLIHTAVPDYRLQVITKNFAGEMYSTCRI